MTKGEFRDDCLKRMKCSNAHTKIFRDAMVRRYLQRVLGKINGKKILAFWPMGFEADIKKNITAIRQRAEVYLPFMDGVSFKMVPLRYPLERKAFGIYEPRDTGKKINLIDIAIVPVVGIDGSLCRIGFGKGMYDRFFPTLKTKPFTIFIQSYECMTTHNLCDDYDVQGDLLITPRGVYGLEDYYVKRTTRRGRSRRLRRSSRIFNFKKDYSRPF